MANKKEEFKHILERDNFTCVYCGIDGSNSFDTWWYANMDIDYINHDLDHAEKHSDENLVSSCRACRTYKGKTSCDDLEEAVSLVVQRREEADIEREKAESWYNSNVLKLDGETY